MSRWCSHTNQHPHDLRHRPERLPFLPHRYARVVREGQEQRLLAEGLVPGDVMLLAEGEHISADGRLVQAADLRVDQSTLLGEDRG